MANPIIVHESQEPGSLVYEPKASATVIEKGQPLSLESNKIVLMDSATEDATFAGFAAADSGSGETDVPVLKRGTVEVDLGAATTLDVGAGIKYNAGDASTAYTFTADGGANTLMWVAQTYDTSTAKIRCDFDVYVLGKLYGVDA